MVYVVLVCALVGLRYGTRDIYPTLRDLRAERSELTLKRRELDLEVQRLSSAARVRAWALENEMIPFTRSQKEVATFSALPSESLTVPQAEPLEVKVKWR